MKSRDYISSFNSDTPALAKSACLTCQNKTTCKSIATAVAVLGSEQILRRSSPSLKKKYAAIADHLRREGFSYPNVRKASHCWMHSKFGVAVFYDNQLSMLSEKVLDTRLRAPEVIRESRQARRSF